MFWPLVEVLISIEYVLVWIYYKLFYFHRNLGNFQFCSYYRKRWCEQSSTCPLVDTSVFLWISN